MWLSIKKSPLIKISIILIFILLINHLLTLISLSKFYDKYLEDIFFNAARAIIYIYLGIWSAFNQITRKIILLFGLTLFFIDHVFLRFFYFLLIFWDSSKSVFIEYFSAFKVLLGSYVVFSPIIILIVFIGYSIGLKLNQKCVKAN